MFFLWRKTIKWWICHLYGTKPNSAVTLAAGFSPQRIAKGRDGWDVDAAVALLSRRFFVVHGLELVLCLFSLARLPPPCLIMFDGTITKPLLDFCTLLCFYNSDAISLMKLLLSFLPGAMGGGGDFGKGSFPDEWTTNWRPSNPQYFFYIFFVGRCW